MYNHQSKSTPVWMRVVRTVLLAIVAGWLFLTFVPGSAQRSVDGEWPRTDFSRTTVDLNEIMSGGPPKDGIPAIDQPRFEDYVSADRWLHEKEPVIALRINGKARAYPIQILMFHEIVNDELNGVPVSITFCPLCNASIVFDRRVQGKELDFGTTGRLRKSDMVMYDRQTESWWQQFTGKGIVGKYAGTELQRLPSNIISYGDYKAAFPGSEVLSQRTGYSRPYGNNPYRGYDRVGESPFLFDDPIDSRLPAMERVLSVTHDNTHKLYPFSILKQQPVVHDSIEGLPIVAFSGGTLLSALDQSRIVDSREIPAAGAFSRLVDGKPLTFEVRDDGIYDRETGSRWNLLGEGTQGPLSGRQLDPLEGGVHFAFAWLAFHPDSDIYHP